MRVSHLKISLFAMLMVAGWTALHSVGVHAQAASGITAIVPFAAGGGTDRQLRGLIPYLSRELRVPVGIENKPGASGMSATIDFIKNQPRNGSVFLAQLQLYLTVGNVSTNEQIDISDLAVIAGISEDIFGIHAKRGSWKDLGQFIAAVQQNPGKYSIGFLPRSAPHVALVAFLKAAGIEGKVREVPYQSGGPARIALLGGHIDADISGTDSSHAAGAEQIQTLGLFSNTPHPKRVEPLINVELARMGIKNKVPDITNFFFYAAHKDVKNKNPEQWRTLVTAFEKSINDPAFVKWFETQGWTQKYVGPEKGQELMLNLDKLAKEHAKTLLK